MGKSLTEIKRLPSSEISSWQAYFTNHVTRETQEKNEHAFTRWITWKSTGRWKDMPLDKFLLDFKPPHKQTQEEITRNLGIVKTALKANNGT